MSAAGQRLSQERHPVSSPHIGQGKSGVAPAAKRGSRLSLCWWSGHPRHPGVPWASVNPKHLCATRRSPP